MSEYSQMDIHMIFKNVRVICLHTITAIVYKLLTNFKYYCLTLRILFDINHLFAHGEVVTSIAI